MSFGVSAPPGFLKDNRLQELTAVKIRMRLQQFIDRPLCGLIFFLFIMRDTLFKQLPD